MLVLGMVVAGQLTDVYGPRWVWGAAAVVSAVSAVVGFVLARAAGAGSRPQRRAARRDGAQQRAGQQASL